MSPDAAYAARMATPVSVLGGAFMISTQARDFSKLVGLRARPAYALGRFSVLGRVDPAVVVAVAGFWNPDVIGSAWSDGIAHVDPCTVRDSYADVIRAWGRAKLGGWPDVQDCRDLVWQVVDAVDIAGAPLAAGWRAVGRDAVDAPGDLLHGLHVLRELRASRHLAAVGAAGLTPLEAVVSGVGGPANAAFFGWSAVLPDAVPLAEQRAAAERLTNEMCAGDWAHLGDVEADRLATLLESAQVAAFS